MLRTGHHWRRVILISPLLLAFVAALIPIFWPPREEPDDDFYIAATQIIPVLLVALIVEVRLEKRWGRRDGRRYGNLIVAFLLVGELSALLEAADILGVMASLSVTGAGLVGGFVAVTVVAVAPSKWFGDAEDAPT
jgi:hypothetical protein